MHLAGVPVVLFEHPHAILKFQQMLPLPSSLNVYFFNSSGQFFSALVIFLFLLGGVVGFPPVFGGSVLLGCTGCWTFGPVVGKGRISMVTLGSVVSFLKSSFRAGWSLTGFKDFDCCCAKMVQSSLSARKSWSSLTAANPAGTSLVKVWRSHCTHSS